MALKALLEPLNALAGGALLKALVAV